MSDKIVNNNNSTSFSSRKRKWATRTSEIFNQMEQIGEGTYGEVYMATNKENNEIVALKKIRMDNEKEGFPITAIREIKILKDLRHENIVQLKDIVTSVPNDPNEQTSIYMVFEYIDHDLTGLMMNESLGWNPTVGQIKWIMKQLLEGLKFCHENHVLHRDIKGSNILIGNKGQLKLADFGLSRLFTEQSRKYTNRVITLWYRPPELLLGCEQYGPPVDLWSAGCILAELLTKRPLFPGQTEVDQVDLIFKLCGTPKEDNWPGVNSLPWYETVKPKTDYKRTLIDHFKQFSSSSMKQSIPKEAIELLDRMLTLDPEKRISAHDALQSRFFSTPPEPDLSWSLTLPPSHEFQAKKRKSLDPKKQRGILGPAPNLPGSHPNVRIPIQPPPPPQQQQQPLPPQMNSINNFNGNYRDNKQRGRQMH